MSGEVQCPKCGSAGVMTHVRAVNREGEKVSNSLLAMIVGGVLYLITSVGAGTFVIFVVGTLILTKLNGPGTIDGGAATGLLSASLVGGVLFSALLYLKGDQRWRAVATIYLYTCATCHHRWEVFRGRSPSGDEVSRANARRR